MALKFRLQGLAETLVDEIHCPHCNTSCNDDRHFATELTRVTFDGIVVVVECKVCGEIFVPIVQKLGIIDSVELKRAVEKDHMLTGEPILENYEMVKLKAEFMNAIRRGLVH